MVDGEIVADGTSGQNGRIVKITIQNSNVDVPQREFHVDLDEVTTIRQLKEIICQPNQWEIENVKLIKKGKPLMDLHSLEESQITEDSSVYVIVNKFPTSQSRSSSRFTSVLPPTPSIPKSPPRPQSGSTAGQAAHNANSLPFSSGSGGFPFGLDMNGESYAEMQQKLMQNPEMMNNIINSPMFQNMIKNPELMQNLMMSNPQIKSLFEKNPHLNQAFKDPSFLSDMMKMYSSQAASDQMNYQNDIALRQLDNSGHFSKVESMFNNINDAFTDWPESNNLLGSLQNNSASNFSNSSNNSTSVPNPWNPSASNLPQQPHQRIAMPNMPRITSDSANTKIEALNSGELKEKMIDDPRLFMLIGSLWQEIDYFFRTDQPSFKKYFVPLGSSIFDNWFRNYNVKIDAGKSGKVEEFLSNPTVSMICAKIADCLLKIADYNISFFLAFFESNNESVFSKVTNHIGKQVRSQKELIQSSLALANAQRAQQQQQHSSPAATSQHSLPKPKASEENIALLLEMGFQREESIAALEKSSNNLERAIEFLFANRN